MKKKSFPNLLALFLFVVAIAWGCNGDSTTKKDESAKQTSGDNPKIIEGRGEQLAFDNVASMNMDNHEIPDKDARSMITYYINNRLYKYKTRGSVDTFKSDTRCIWYDKAFIKTLADAIDAEKGDGIRIYFGVYDSTKYDTLRLCKTTIFTITKDAVAADGKNHFHADILTNTGENKKLWEMQNDIFKKNKSAMTVYDRGSLCPPPFPCSSAGAYLLPPGF